MIGVLQGEALPAPQKKRVASQGVNYEGFLILGFVAALIGSLIYSVLGIVIDSALNSLFTKK